MKAALSPKQFVLTILACHAIGAQEPAESRLPPTTVCGRIVDEQRRPIEGACLAIAGMDWDSQRLLRAPDRRTDASGRFELSVPALTPWTDDLRFCALGAPGRAVMAVTPRPLAFGSPRLDLGDVVLPVAATLRGRIVGPGGKPIAGANVIARDRMLGQLEPYLHWFGTTMLSVACSGEDGTFELPGLSPDGSRLRIQADGFAAQERSLSAYEAPLSIELQPSGFAAGRVLGPDGKPCRAMIWVEHEAGDSSDGTSSAPDGTFRISLDHPHRYRLHVSSRSLQWQGSAGPFGAPRDGIEIRLAPSPELDPTAKPLVLLVTDARTGGAVVGLRASITWVADGVQYLGDDDPGTMLMHRTIESGEPGRIVVPGPPNDEPAGILWIGGEGHAPRRIDDVEWQPGRKLDVQLEPEAIVAGVVREAGTGLPRPHVLVTVDVEESPSRMQDLYFTGTEIPGRCTRTGADGTFRLRGLGAGTHRIRAIDPDLPDSEPLGIDVTAGERKENVVLVVRPGSSIAGHVTGAEPQADWRLLLLDRGAATPGFGFGDELAHSSPVAPDGSFHVGALTPGEYVPVLRIPHRHGHGGSIRIALPAITLRDRELRPDFDVADMLPGTVRGRIRLDGAQLPAGRLLALAAQELRTDDARRYSPHDCAIEPVAADGTFRLPVGRGPTRVAIVDAETGILFAERRGITVTAGGVQELELQQPITELTVRLRPEQDGGAIVASRLVVVAADAAGSEDDRVHEPPGAALGGRTEIRLFVPRKRLKLSVLVNPLQDVSQMLEAPAPLVERELTPGDRDVVEMIVPPPKN